MDKMRFTVYSRAVVHSFPMNGKQTESMKESGVSMIVRLVSGEHRMPAKREKVANVPKFRKMSGAVKIWQERPTAQMSLNLHRIEFLDGKILCRNGTSRRMPSMAQQDSWKPVSDGADGLKTVMSSTLRAKEHRPFRCLSSRLAVSYTVTMTIALSSDMPQPVKTV